MKTLLSSAALLGALAFPALAYEGTVRPIIDRSSEINHLMLVPTCAPGTPIEVSGSRFVCGKKPTGGGMLRTFTLRNPVPSGAYVFDGLGNHPRIGAITLSLTTIGSNTQKAIWKQGGITATSYRQISSNRYCDPSEIAEECACPTGYRDYLIFNIVRVMPNGFEMPNDLYGCFPN